MYPVRDGFSERTRRLSRSFGFALEEKPGTVGAAMSHSMAWELAAESTASAVLVFEDDGKFHANTNILPYAPI